MQVEITFGDEQTELSPSQGARIIADLNYLHMAAIALASGQLGFLPVLSTGEGPERYGLAATIDRGPDGVSFSRLIHVEFGSPFKIISAIFHLPEIFGQLRLTWKVIEGVAMLKTSRERFEAETSLIRQQALAAEIANFRHLRELLDRVHDEAERERLEKAVTAGIIALIDGRHPPVTEMKINNSASETHQ